MDDTERITGEGVTIGLCLGCLIMAAGYGLPELAAVLPIFPKDASWWGISIGTTTLAVAVTGGILAALSYRMNRGVSRSSRFKDAVNLLAQTGPVTAIAGIAVIEQVSLEARRQYGLPAVETLNYYSQEAEPECGKIGHKRGIMPTYQQVAPVNDWPDSNHAALEALFAAGRLVNKFGGVPSFTGALVEGRYLLNKAFISGIVVTGQSLRNCWVQHGVLNNVHFERCDFRNTRIDVVIGPGVIFRDCDLTGSQFWFHDNSGRPLLQAEHRVSFEECDGILSCRTFDTDATEYMLRLQALPIA